MNDAHSETSQPKRKFSSQPISLPIESLRQDPHHPRRDLGPEEEQDKLTESLRKYRMMQPIHVMELGNDRYMIIDGMRRYISALRLGWDTVPCEVYSKLTKNEILELQWKLQEPHRKARKGDQQPKVPRGQMP